MLERATRAPRPLWPMRGAAARIVEIGGQFDTQHLEEHHMPGQKVRQVTAAGSTLRERAARFHATPTREKVGRHQKAEMLVGLSCLAVA